MHAGTRKLNFFFLSQLVLYMELYNGRLLQENLYFIFFAQVSRRRVTLTFFFPRTAAAKFF